jgi:hypothetical protein
MEEEKKIACPVASHRDKCTHAKKSLRLHPIKFCCRKTRAVFQLKEKEMLVLLVLQVRVINLLRRDL